MKFPLKKGIKIAGLLCVSFFVLLIIVIFSLEAYVDSKWKNETFQSALEDCRKIWTARGLYGQEIEQNSIESIREAFARGALGVEVDIHYDVKKKDYIISHDFPYNLKNGRILYLKELFHALGEGHYFWLDFKKLRRLNRKQVGEAVQRLIDICPSNLSRDRVYVEGENPTNLSYFHDAGFATILDTHPEPSNRFLARIMIAGYKVLFFFGEHTVMGMEYGTLDNPVYGPETRDQLGQIPVFLYHVPVDEALIDSLLEREPVRAFLVGNNQSVDFYSKTACEEDVERSQPVPSKLP